MKDEKTLDRLGFMLEERIEERLEKGLKKQRKRLGHDRGMNRPLSSLWLVEDSNLSKGQLFSGLDRNCCWIKIHAALIPHTKAP